MRKYLGSSAKSCPNLDLPTVSHSTYLEDPASRLYICAECICVYLQHCHLMIIGSSLGVQEFQTLPLHERGLSAVSAASRLPFRKKSGRPASELGAVRVFFFLSSCLVDRSAAFVKPLNLFCFIFEKTGPCGVQTQ